MSLPFQPRLFDDWDEPDDRPDDLGRANLGTFQDSLNAPIHSWFVYPAGFSYKAVEQAFNFYHITPGMRVYDPFAGTGTTNVVASQRGIDSFGIEAHPFVYFIARTKTFWDFDFVQLRSDIEQLIKTIRDTIRQQADDSSLEAIYPELIHKCYTREKLLRLHVCRTAIEQLSPTPFQDFAKVGLTHLLRAAADVTTGWPYIAPQKAKKASPNHADITSLLRDQLFRMLTDLQSVRAVTAQTGRAVLINGDARKRQEAIESQSVNLAFTSPPYLNNYDYADRTRLEMYFWGRAKTWRDITHQVRDRLMMSATTQINRSDYDVAKLLSENLVNNAPLVSAELQPKIQALSKLRLQKGGKKSYDILVAGYFNDMLRVLQETYRILEPGASFVMILGDSAPYGVYIPTHTYLGEIAKTVGFADYKVEHLRKRGDKWKDNPQRHKVPLQESILTLRK
ncbi:MAG: hypothetical protein HXY41_16895 [Chloroflexi bacterium]|nr:hypothetical protein [Chloroflexota bacterium]